MWKKIAMSAACGAAVIGVGTAALAESGSGSSGASPAGVTTSDISTVASTSDLGSGAKKAVILKRLARLAHVTWVAADKDGKFVTHDAIHGTVTAVSSTSVTVKAGDGVSQTYVVTTDTKVRVRDGKGKGAAGKIGDVKPGQHTLVIGTGTTTFTATGIVTGLAK
jgi:hypothetical protein